MSDVCPTCGRKKRQSAKHKSGTPGGFHDTVGHILKTFETRKGAKYPFTEIDGRAIKRLLLIYGPYAVKALWDAFLDLHDEWRQKTGHTLFEFQRAIPALLDNSDWKSRARKYEGEVASSVSTLVSFKDVEHRPQ